MTSLSFFFSPTSQAPVIYTHRDNGAFWDRGFEYPAARKARRRVSQNPGPKTPIIPVCNLTKKYKETIKENFLLIISSENTCRE